MFTGCDKLPIVLQHFNGDQTVQVELQINHETHWAYFSIYHLNSFAIEIINEVTVMLRDRFRLIVKNMNTLIHSEYNMDVCLYFEQDHDTTRRLVSTLAHQSLLEYDTVSR